MSQQRRRSSALSWRATSSRVDVAVNRPRPETNRNPNPVRILTKASIGPNQFNSVTGQSPRLWSSIVGSIQPDQGKFPPTKIHEPTVAISILPKHSKILPSKIAEPSVVGSIRPNQSKILDPTVISPILATKVLPPKPAEPSLPGSLPKPSKNLSLKIPKPSIVISVQRTPSLCSMIREQSLPVKPHSNTCWCRVTDNPFQLDLSSPIDWAMPVDYEFDDDQDDETHSSIQLTSNRTSNDAITNKSSSAPMNASMANSNNSDCRSGLNKRCQSPQRSDIIDLNDNRRNANPTSLRSPMSHLSNMINGNCRSSSNSKPRFHKPSTAKNENCNGRTSKNSSSKSKNKGNRARYCRKTTKL